MKAKIVIFLLASMWSFASLFAADDLDLASQEALLKTQRLLTDPEKRQEAISGEQAVWIDQQVKSLGGSPENVEAIYGLAADIFGDLAKEARGDPAKMLELLEKVKKDPASFENKLTPAQREKLRAISLDAKPPKKVP